jgi:hypothetical protein
MKLDTLTLPDIYAMKLDTLTLPDIYAMKLPYERLGIRVGVGVGVEVEQGRIAKIGRKQRARNSRGWKILPSFFQQAIRCA